MSTIALAEPRGNWAQIEGIPSEGIGTSLAALLNAVILPTQANLDQEILEGEGNSSVVPVQYEILEVEMTESEVLHAYAEFFTSANYLLDEALKASEPAIKRLKSRMEKKHGNK